VVVALKGMLWQIGHFFEFKKQSIIDGSVWLTTFLAVVIINIDVGLLVGFAVSTIFIFVRNMRPYVTLLGLVPNTDLYLDINHYGKAVEIPGLKIFRYW
jgi:MFS superfamily sulfate permease-like transporter